MKTIVVQTARSILFYMLFCVAVFLMLRIIVPHISLGDQVGFLQEKQRYVHQPFWRAAFYVHVFSGIFTLLSGATQFSGFLLREYRSLHRIMGRIYVWDILLINFPAGMVLALTSNGAWHTSLAFVLLDCLWFWFTWKAVAAIRQGNVPQHRDYMLRSYALTFSVITLRSWKQIMLHSISIEPELLYMIDAWLGFVPNLMLAELWIALRKRQSRRTSVPVS